MHISTEESGSRYTVTMSGSFTFADNQDYRALLKDVKQKSANFNFITIDMKAVDFIDSAGLGMLLLLRDAMNSAGHKVELRGSQGQVRKMFDLSNFAALFSITD